jgi:ribosome biogenesis GTPase A
MKSKISSVDVVIECRDFRAPVCSINPLFNEALGEKSRLIVYTKRDLGGDGKKENKEVGRILSREGDTGILLSFLTVPGG